MPKGHVYFHSPCFDGIVSAALITDWLENTGRWSQSSLHVVNYQLQNRWLSTRLERPSAVVDFLFHPDADFWADHHRTTFVGLARPKQGRGRVSLYDPTAGSCAGLLWRYLFKAFRYRNKRFADLVRWAEKIDAARYDSVNEALASDAPALRVNAALSVVRDDDLPQRLVRLLRQKTLAEVAEIREIRQRYRDVRQIMDLGLDRLKRAARMEDGIVVFDVDAHDIPLNRYAPYHFFPQARYSAGIVRTGNAAKITVMRNPWISFRSVPLGDICERYGGGGHQRVGAILLTGPRVPEASDVLNRVIHDIRQRDRRRDHAFR